MMNPDPFNVWFQYLFFFLGWPQVFLYHNPSNIHNKKGWDNTFHSQAPCLQSSCVRLTSWFLEERSKFEGGF